MKKTLLLFLFAAFTFVAFAQQEQYHPYKKFGSDIEVLTLSNGKYDEFFDYDTIAIVGSAVLNTKTMKVIGFVEEDTMYSEATMEPEVVSRWLSPDPLARKYPNLSPYNFAANSPIMFIDPDGRDILIALGGIAKSSNDADVGVVTADIVNTIVKEVNSIDPDWDFNAQTFAADILDQVKSNVIKYIKENYTEGEKIVLYGYSWGAETVTEIARDMQDDPILKDVKIDMLITVDAAKGPFSSSAERDVSSNVIENVNIYQTKEKPNMFSRGAPNTADDPNSTNVNNFRLDEYYGKEVDHGNIDNASKSNVQNLIRNAFGIEQKPINPEQEIKNLPAAK